MNNSKTICCFCLNDSQTQLINLYSKSGENLTYIDKISSSLSHLANVLKELDCNKYSACTTCCNTIEMVYDFNRSCLNNVQVYSSYELKINKDEQDCNTSIVVATNDLHTNISHQIFIKTEPPPYNDDEITSPNVTAKEEFVSTDYCQVDMGVEEFRMDTLGTSGSKRNICATDFQYSKKSRIYINTWNPNSERVIESWLADEDSSGSEVDDVGVDFYPEHSEHDTDTSTDISDTDETQPEHLDALSSDEDDPLLWLGYFRGKNKYKWSKLPPNRSSVRTPQHNIISRVPTTNLTQNYGKDPYSLWKQYLNDEMLSEILFRTNEKLAEHRSKYMKQNSPELKDIDIIELQAFIGLLMYTAVFQSNHEDADLIFATDGTGRDIFRCVMSKNRYLCLLHCLRFDNALDRAQRKETNKLAAISNIFNKFVSNCQKVYNIGRYATVDEMLVLFRGRSFLMINMPKKPAEYGLKLMCLCDAENGYFYNCYVYCGKGTDGETLTNEERKLLVPTQAVIRLSKPLHGSNKNITCDKWFTSIELIDALKQKGLTCVGTVKKNKREIPPEFLPAKLRQEKSTLYAFTENTTLLSHVPKKGKVIILASSMHHNEGTNTDSGQPEIIAFYNSTKGGVVEIDKKCSVYTCSRRSRRWPMIIFYRILDISSINAHLLHDLHVGRQTDRGTFIKKLARQLVLEHIKRRFCNLRLPRELRMSLTRVLGSDKPETCEDEPEEVKTRRTCLSCQPKLKRKSTYRCYLCKKHVCLQCAKQVCPDCA